MNFLIDIGHPAHVHFFKNMIWNLKNDGHEVKILARDKEVTIQLLDGYGLEYEISGEIRNSLLSKSFYMIRRDYKLYNAAKKFKPDIVTGICNPYVAHVGKFIRKPSITFTDTEYVKIAGKLTYPFTNTICTPACFQEKLNPKKHVRYDGYHELAYLHPNYFKPDPTVLDELGLSKKDKFIILRLISWDAAHDTTLKGIDEGSETALIKSLERYGQIFITSERKLSKELERYRITAPPEKIHTLLAFSQLYLGEGGTMATESAVLGTPSIHVEAATTDKPCAVGIFMGNFIELRDKYGLMYTFQNQGAALDKALEILENKNSKKEWQRKREKLLNEKIDVTRWMTNFVEYYPQSFHEYMRGVSS